MHLKVPFHNCPNRQSDNYCRGKNNGASQNLWKISQHTSFFWFPAKLGIILVKGKPVSLIANKVSIREVGFFSRLSRVLSRLSRTLSHLSRKLSHLNRKLSCLSRKLSHLSRKRSHLNRKLSCFSLKLSHLSRKLSRLSWKLFLLGRKLFFLGENHFLSGNYLFRLYLQHHHETFYKKTAENCFLYGLNGFTEKPKSFIPKHQQQL